MGWVTILMSN